MAHNMRSKVLWGPQFSDSTKTSALSCLFYGLWVIPVVDAGLGLSVPQTDLHASRNINGQPSLKLCTRLQTRLQLDDLQEQRAEEKHNGRFDCG